MFETFEIERVLCTYIAMIYKFNLKILELRKENLLTEFAIFLAEEITQVMDSIPLVRCASVNVDFFWHPSKRVNKSQFQENLLARSGKLIQLGRPASI